MNVIDVLAILPYYVSLFLMEPEVMPDPSEVSYIAATTSTTSTTINPLLDEPEEGGASFDDVRRIIQVNKQLTHSGPENLKKSRPKKPREIK